MPAEISKMTIGLGFAVLALLALAAGAGLSGAGKVGIGWLLAFHVLNAIGMANYIPVGLALYARAAPRALSGTMIGIFYMHLFLANNLVGWLGGLIEWMPATQFWLLHAGLTAAAGMVLLVVARLYGAVLAPTADDDCG
jgi:POT family proton-dependent oligopeptide transporter